MGKIDITIKNASNGKSLAGTVLSEDTVEGVIQDLLGQQAFSNLSRNARLKTDDDITLELHKTIEESNLVNGQTLIIGDFSEYLGRHEVTPKPPRPIIPRTFHQLAILVLDGSYSMDEECQGGLKKREAVIIAIRGLFSRFKESRVNNNFSFAILTFDTTPNLVIDVTPAKEINENGSYDPIKGNGNGTYIHSGLSMAAKLADTFLKGIKPDSVPHSVVILLLSDGECHEPNKTKEIASDIKRNPQIKICTTFFSKAKENASEAEMLMKNIASEPMLFKNTYDAETLRSFFEVSMSLTSGVKN